jgi:hypothetical protein
MTRCAICLPAYLCYSPEMGYFVQVGQGRDAEWFARDGEQIPELTVYPYRTDEFRQTDLWHTSRFRTVGELGMVDDVAVALGALDHRFPACGYKIIYLADNEYGNELMDRIAAEFFEANPNEQFVLVYEHAGWYLGYRRDGTRWATANDTARLTQLWPQPANGCTGEVMREAA